MTVTLIILVMRLKKTGPAGFEVEMNGSSRDGSSRTTNQR